MGQNGTLYKTWDKLVQLFHRDAEINIHTEITSLYIVQAGLNIGISV